MTQAVGVRFRGGPILSYFDRNGLTVRRGVKVVAETPRGLELGEVSSPERNLSEIPPSVELPEGDLPPLLRIASVEDLQRWERLAPLEERAQSYSLERIRSRGISMKLIEAIYSLDESKVTLYFTSNGRVDFRDLLKDLNSHLRCRVHLHQIGARDAARMLGGIGPCGQELCCSRWLQTFDPVSMKMAKDQSLFLNPSKFSGVCGKLMCCLRYEHETYLLTQQAMPPVGTMLETPQGTGKVIEQIVPREIVLVDVPDFGIVEVATSVNVSPTQPRCRGGGGCSASDCGNCGSNGCQSCGVH